MPNIQIKNYTFMIKMFLMLFLISMFSVSHTFATELSFIDKLKLEKGISESCLKSLRDKRENEMTEGQSIKYCHCYASRVAESITRDEISFFEETHNYSKELMSKVVAIGENCLSHNFSKSTSESDNEVFVSYKHGFSMQYPKSWNKGETIHPQTVIRVESIDGEDYNITVFYSSDLVEMSTDDYVDGMLATNTGPLVEMLYKSYKNVRLVNKGKTQLSQQAAVFYTIDFTLNALGTELPMRSYIVMTKHEGKQYTLTFRCPQVFFEEYLPIIRVLALGFQFIKLKAPPDPVMINDQKESEGIHDINSITWLLKAAEAGDVDAQISVGSFYEDSGETKKAFSWYKKAALQGNTKAQNKVGYMYYFGVGIYRHHIEAVSWFKKSAEKGYADAQYNLAYMYKSGKGLTKNRVKFLDWTKKADMQGIGGCKVDCINALSGW